MRLRLPSVLESRGRVPAVRLAVALASTALAPTLQAQSAAARPPVPGAPAGVKAFVDVAVVPMDRERVLEHQTVLVQQGWITALGPTTKVRVPAGAVRIDGRGRYLIPGLADMHTHILSRTRDSVEIQERLFAWLANGVTTVRNLDYTHYQQMGADEKFPLRLRARAAAGEVLSPRIYTAGPWGPIQYTGTKPDPRVPRLDSVAAYVAAYQAAGYDFLKVHDEQPAVMESLLVAARRVGIPLLGHVRPSLGLERALASGTYVSIEHLRGYLWGSSPRDSLHLFTTARIEALAAATQRAGVWNCPTMILEEGHRRPAEVVVRRQLVKALQDAGAGLLLGTDAPLAGPAYKELAALVRAGLTPYQALLTGTRNVAQYFGTLDSTGTVAVGKRADLVLVNGNPLEDIQHATQLTGVMLGGRWVAHEAVAVVERTWAEVRSIMNGALEPLYKQLPDAQLTAVSQVGRGFQAERRALRDSLVASGLRGNTDSVTGYRRALRLVARQFGALRAALPSEHQAVLDPEIRKWLHQRAGEEHPVEVPGLKP